MCYSASTSFVEDSCLCQYASRLRVCIVRRRRFALMCVGNKMMRHVFLYLSCFDLVACSFSCNQWLDILKHGFWWNLYCVGVGLSMPLDCYRALRAYMCPFVVPVQWRTAALFRSYEDACSTVVCKAISHYNKLIHRVADNDLHHYAFYEMRNTAPVMKNIARHSARGCASRICPRMHRLVRPAERHCGS